MFKIHYLLIIVYIVLFFNSKIYSQDKDVEDKIVKANRIAFKFNDKFYPYTIYFRSLYSKYSIGVLIADEYKENPFGNKNEIITHEFDNKGKTINKYREVFKYSSADIDTLISYFPLLNINSEIDTIDKELLFMYGVLPMYPKKDTSYNLSKELLYSYLLRLMNEPTIYTLKINKVIRIVYREKNNFQSIRINILKDSARVYTKHLSFKDINSNIKNDKKIFLLNKRELKILNKVISNINFPYEGIDCMSEDDYWLLEYKDGLNYYIFLRSDKIYARKHLENIDYFNELKHLMTLFINKRDRR